MENRKIRRAVSGTLSTVSSGVRAFRRGSAWVRHKIRSAFGIQLNRRIFGEILNVVALGLFGLVFILPIVYTICNAFKPSDELFLFPPKLFPQRPTLENFSDLSALMGESWVPFSRYVFNTILITAAGTAAHVIFASMAAYVLGKYEFPGSKAFFAMVTAALMFSPIVTSVPNMLIMSGLGWMDTYWAVIIPAIGQPLGLFLMKQFMETLPDSILEAALIDGARQPRIFFKIVMPAMKPAWLTLIIFSAQNLWNTGGNIGFYIRSEELKNLPYALNSILTGGVARAGAGSAVGLLLISVPIIIFILAQSNIIDTMTTSGMKE